VSIEVLGWIATALLLVGYWLNAKKQISSWFFWMIGNSMMLVYAALIESNSVAFLSVVLIALNIYGYFSWKNESK
jgi:nicotinamide riboside transporter PnuC